MKEEGRKLEKAQPLMAFNVETHTLLPSPAIAFVKTNDSDAVPSRAQNKQEIIRGSRFHPLVKKETTHGCEFYKDLHWQPLI